MSKTQKKTKNKSGKNNFLTVLAGIALGLVLVFAIVAVDLFSKMNIISFGNDPTEENTGFVEVTEAGDDIEIIDTLEELRDVGDLSSVLKNWAENNTDHLQQ